MIAAYVLIGAIGGLLAFSGGLFIGVPFWTAMLFYPTGGTTLIVFALLWRHLKMWGNPEGYQPDSGDDHAGRSGFNRVA